MRVSFPEDPRLKVKYATVTAIQIDEKSIVLDNGEVVTVKAYTGAEIEFFSRISGLSMKEVLQELIKAGLDTLPGVMVIMFVHKCNACFICC